MSARSARDYVAHAFLSGPPLRQRTRLSVWLLLAALWVVLASVIAARVSGLSAPFSVTHFASMPVDRQDLGRSSTETLGTLDLRTRVATYGLVVAVVRDSSVEATWKPIGGMTGPEDLNQLIELVETRALARTAGHPPRRGLPDLGTWTPNPAMGEYTLSARRIEADPLGLALTLAAAPALLLGVWTLTHADRISKAKRTLRTLAEGECPACGYDLTGVLDGVGSRRCPECGLDAATEHERAQEVLRAAGAIHKR